MADALYYLSEELAWAPTSAPRGELVLIRDAVESSGSFLVQHFVALFLKAGAPRLSCSCRRQSRSDSWEPLYACSSFLCACVCKR